MIDAHHHFWNYDPVEYGWISNEMSILRRDFGPQDLRAEMDAAGVDGAVSVQARQTIDETRWLLDLASQHDFMRGVVGWVPLVDADVATHLERFASDRKLKAVRHVIQDEPEDGFILRDDFNRGISLLKRFDLRYDVLIFDRHLPQTIEFVDRHPDQIFILDHVAKPRIRDGIFDDWRQNLCTLARRENVYCKLSGMVTEADWRSWTPAQLRPYVDVALEAFTPRRMMFGSDWPVCLAACEYARWANVVREFARDLSPSEQDRLFGGTAIEAYDL